MVDQAREVPGREETSASTPDGLYPDGRRALVALAPSIALPVLTGLLLWVVTFPGGTSPPPT